ncbi:MAG: hypothetical protein VX563_06020, partial [Planctomycetota bacterium]|nr:hypothetical protein [Planctomycetota bacterium]
MLTGIGGDSALTWKAIEEEMLGRIREREGDVRLDARGVLEFDEHVIGTWLGLRAYELGKERRGAADAPELAPAAVPDFAPGSGVRLASEPVSTEEARGACALAAACRPFFAIGEVTREEGWTGLYPADCVRARASSPPLFSQQANFDTLHAFAWSVPMLTLQRTRSRAAFLSTLLRAARICSASSNHAFLMHDCSHGVGHAVIADTRPDEQPAGAFVRPPSVAGLRRRYAADARTLSSGTPAPDDEDPEEGASTGAFRYVLDCAVYGRAVHLLGGDRVFSTGACLTGVFHQLLVYDIGFKDDGDVGRRTDPIVRYSRATPTGRARARIVGRPFPERDMRVHRVLLHHCFALADAYLEQLLLDGADGSDEERLAFGAALKSGASACFFNTGFFSSYSSMFSDAKEGVAARLKHVLLDLAGGAMGLLRGGDAAARKPTKAEREAEKLEEA